MEFAKKSIKFTAGFVIIRLGIIIWFLSAFSSNFFCLHNPFSLSVPKQTQRGQTEAASCVELLPCNWRCSENQVKGLKSSSVDSQSLEAIVINKMVFLLLSLAGCSIWLTIYLFNGLYLYYKPWVCYRVLRNVSQLMMIHGKVWINCSGLVTCIL